MSLQPLNTKNETTLRWIFSIVLPVSVLIILFLFFKTSTQKKLSPPLQLELSYFIVEKKTEKKTEKKAKLKPTPLTPLKRVKRSEKKLQKNKAVEKTITPLKESEPTETAADIMTGELVSNTNLVVTPKIPETQTVFIKSPQELDNSSFSPIYNPKPHYPTIAKKNRITGFVDLDLSIDKKGKVTDFVIIKTVGHPSFAKEVSKVILSWKFPQPRFKGEIFSVIYRYRVRFKLN